MSMWTLSQQVFQDLLLLTMWTIGILLAWLVGLSVAHQRRADEQLRFLIGHQLSKKQADANRSFMMQPVSLIDNRSAVASPQQTSHVDKHQKEESEADEDLLDGEEPNRWVIFNKKLSKAIGGLLLVVVIVGAGWYGYQNSSLGYRSNNQPVSRQSEKIGALPPTPDSAPASVSPADNGSPFPDMSPSQNPSPAASETAVPANASLHLRASLPVITPKPTDRLGPSKELTFQTAAVKSPLLVYSNMDFGFNLSYPSDWHVETSRAAQKDVMDQTKVTFRQKNAAEPAQAVDLQLTIETADGSARPSQWIQKRYNTPVIATLQTTVIHGLTAEQLTITQTDTPRKRLITILATPQGPGSKPTKFFIFTLNGSPQADNYAKQLRQAQDIVSSFVLR